MGHRGGTSTSQSWGGGGHSPQTARGRGWKAGCGAPGAQGPSCLGTVAQAREAPRGGWTPPPNPSPASESRGRGTGAGLCLSPQRHREGCARTRGTVSSFPQGPEFSRRDPTRATAPVTPMLLSHSPEASSRAINRLPPRPAHRPLWAQPPLGRAASFRAAGGARTVGRVPSPPARGTRPLWAQGGWPGSARARLPGVRAAEIHVPSEPTDRHLPDQGSTQQPKWHVCMETPREEREGKVRGSESNHPQGSNGNQRARTGPGGSGAKRTGWLGSLSLAACPLWGPHSA